MSELAEEKRLEKVGNPSCQFKFPVIGWPGWSVCQEDGVVVCIDKLYCQKHYEIIAKPDEKLREEIALIVNEIATLAVIACPATPDSNHFTNQILAILPQIRREGRQEVIDWVKEHTHEDNINVGFYSNPKYGLNMSYESRQLWKAKIKEWEE